MQCIYSVTVSQCLYILNHLKAEREKNQTHNTKAKH